MPGGPGACAPPLALGSRGFAQVLDALPDPNRGGLGVLEALHWLHGGRVYGTSRIASTGAGLRLQMDVTDDAPVQRAIDTIIEREGRLDISANNAGIAIRGPAGASYFPAQK